MTEDADSVSEGESGSSVTVTKKAADKIRALLKRRGKEGWGLRFGYESKGCRGWKYILELEELSREGDEIFHSHGVIIYVSRRMVGDLSGSQIDWVEGSTNAKFRVMNPNAKRSCACGRSQSG